MRLVLYAFLTAWEIEDAVAQITPRRGIENASRFSGMKSGLCKKNS